MYGTVTIKEVGYSLSTLGVNASAVRKAETPGRWHGKKGELCTH